MQINDGKEPQLDETELPRNVKIGDEWTLTKDVKLSDSDLENFDLKQLNCIFDQISVRIYSIEDLKKKNPKIESLFRETILFDLETLYAFKLMLHNSIQKVNERAGITK